MAKPRAQNRNRTDTGRGRPSAILTTSKSTNTKEDDAASSKLKIAHQKTIALPTRVVLQIAPKFKILTSSSGYNFVTMAIRLTSDKALDLKKTQRTPQKDANLINKPQVRNLPQSFAFKQSSRARKGLRQNYFIRRVECSIS
jgi:hypothetical protein